MRADLLEQPRQQYERKSPCKYCAGFVYLTGRLWCGKCKTWYVCDRRIMGMV